MQKAKTLLLAAVAALGLGAGPALARDATDPVFALLQTQGAQATAAYYLAASPRQPHSGALDVDRSEDPRHPLQILLSADGNGG